MPYGPVAMSRAGSGSRWFRSNSDMSPGDTIVVPIDAGPMRSLPFWGVFSTILASPLQ